MSDDSAKQSLHGGDNSILVQAGRDVVLPITKSPPDIKLVRVTIEGDTERGGRREKINIITKNNGDITAFIQRGRLVVMGHAKIVDCNKIHMNFNLSRSSWRYDVNIDAPEASFVGRHSIAPSEVINFDVMVGRKAEGLSLTIYQAFLRLEFDEGQPLETGPFYLQLMGPFLPKASFTSRGPTSDEWGQCMADNIRRLDEIGYDYRPMIHPNSTPYIEAVAPGLLNKNDQ